MSQAHERRQCVRYSAIDNQMVLSWSESEGAEHEQLGGRLIDVSQTGAMCLVSGKPPRPGQRVWVRLDKPAPTEWSEAMIVRGPVGWRSWLGIEKQSVVRLKFLEACPYDFFKLATHGTQLDEAFRAPETSEFEIGIWR